MNISLFYALRYHSPKCIKELKNRKIRFPYMNDITINEYKIEHNEVEGNMK